MEKHNFLKQLFPFGSKKKDSSPMQPGASSSGGFYGDAGHSDGDEYETGSSSGSFYGNDSEESTSVSGSFYGSSDDSFGGSSEVTSSSAQKTYGMDFAKTMKHIQDMNALEMFLIFVEIVLIVYIVLVVMNVVPLF